MSDSLTYYGALRLLGKPKNRLVVLLDGAATVGLTAWAGAAWKDAGTLLSLLAVKNEVVRYGHEIARRAAGWHAGLSRFDRSSRLAAAHAVLVVSAYFEALGQADLPVPVDRLELSDAEKAAMAAGGAVPDGFAAMIELLLRERLPIPEPHRHYADVRQDLRGCYGRMSGRLLRFVSGIAVWEELDHASRLGMEEAIRALPASALERYDAAYASLAADNREFEVWAGLTQAHAVGAALSGMSSMLAGMAARQPGERPRAHLALSYQAALDEPIAGSGQAPEDVVLPSLREAYVNPVCKVAEVGPGDTPSVGDWWAGRELVADIEAFLAGYLTSPRAARAPLVVLGEPGSGKSKLLEVLAARLPEQDFLPVLVELRDVAAESLVVEQIEQAILRRPGERVGWHDLLDAAEGALPVVLLDGFDELLQAAAAHRYDYLEQVREFQRTQAQVGRPVAVIVTSRTVVADHARFPVESLALQLQPFTGDQVDRWIEVWNRYNLAGLTARGLRPLDPVTVRDHRELAGQPLLLLMLAIFDAADNGLHRAGSGMERADLYERLLIEFAFREITKSAGNRALHAARQHQLAERDIQRLAVVALAMFNRGKQAVTDAELDSDLPILFPDLKGTASGTDTALTPAQRATGRFFFVHKSQARAHGDTTRSYEFLHATFGEFLVARLAVSALRDLAYRQHVLQHSTTAAGRLDDGFLFAALSFSCMAERTPIVSFLAELLRHVPADEQAGCRDMLTELINRSLHAHPSRSFQEYEPQRHTTVRRLAAYSANLILMLVLLTGDVHADEFTGGTDNAQNWTQYGALWRSALTATEWRGMVDAIRVRVARTTERLTITLAPEDGTPVSPAESMLITEHDIGLSAYDLWLTPAALFPNDAQIGPLTHAGRVFRDFAFLPSWHASTLLIQAIPALRVLGGDARIHVADDTQVIPGYLLAHLDYSASSSAGRGGLYERYLQLFGSVPRFREQLLLRLQRDAPVFPPATVAALLQTANIAPPDNTYLALINDLWHRPDAASSRPALISLVADIRSTWPNASLDQLITELRYRQA